MARRKRGGLVRRLLIGIGATLAVLLAVIVMRALGTEERAEGRPGLEIVIDRDRAVEVLAEYVRWDSSSPRGVPRDPRPPHLDLLIERYAEPLGLEHRVLDGRTLLLIWRAGEVDGRPILLLSHSDVVPVAEDELESWTHPPFEGIVDEGFVWGRGTLDDKGSTIAQLEAIAAMQAAGLSPHRNIVLLISPDEEIGGEGGVGRVLAQHVERLEDPWAVLDEGSFVAPDFVPGTTLVPVAVAEKRFVTLTLTVVGEAGHSSMPRENAAPNVLALALGRLTELDAPARILPAMDVFLDRVSDRVPFLERVALKNRWLLGSFVERNLASRPASNAMIHDTVALTILEAGIAANVVPARAVATINMRLLPDSELPEVLAHIERVIDDPRITIEVTQDHGASPASTIEGEEWTRLESALVSAFPGDDALVAPMITPATTDARFFARAGIPTYRLVPFVLDSNERGRVHGIDERISIQNLEEAARVYAHLMRYW